MDEGVEAVKGLFCAECVTLRTLHRGNLAPVACDCGNVTGWWLDGSRGVARYTADRPAYAYGVGLNNHLIEAVIGTYGSPMADEQWRELHGEATTAPGYLFDQSRRGCWVILFKPGTVRDVEWATNEEREAAGLPPYPAHHALAPKVDTP